MPVGDLGLLDQQPEDGGQGICGGSKAQGANESQQICRQQALNICETQPVMCVAAAKYERHMQEVVLTVSTTELLMILLCKGLCGQTSQNSITVTVTWTAVAAVRLMVHGI